MTDRHKIILETLEAYNVKKAKDIAEAIEENLSEAFD